MVYEVVAHEREGGSCPYNDFREVVRRSGDKKALGIVNAVVNKLRENGLALLATNMMDRIEDQIFELRPGDYRIVCFYDQPSNKFVL